MYTPPAFKEDDPAVLREMIRASRLATLVTATAEGLVATPLPLLLDDTEGEHGVLYGHVAKANPQWRLEPIGPALALFPGPDAYVTPSWYETKRETGKVVPTWNYAIVQVRGMVRVIDDAQWIAQQISDLTLSQEGAREAPWAVTDAPPNFIQSQIKGIIGLEIEIAEISGKWKVSQNRPVADRVGVAEGLEKEAAGAPDMARLVRSWGGIDSQ